MFFSSFIYTKEENNHYKTPKDKDYLLKLVIPKISLNKTIYNIGDYLNNVEYNVEILESSNIENNTIFLASHSGRGQNCYFNRLKELKNKDNIFIIIGNKKLVYEVTDIYYIIKNGQLEIEENIANTIYLITCSTINTNKQLIIKGKLIN